MKTKIVASLLGLAVLAFCGCTKKLEGENASLRAEVAALKTTVAANAGERDRLNEQIKQLLAAEHDRRESERGEISGTVTYYFNKNFGYKADTGAEIAIFPESAYPFFDAEKMKHYLSVRLSAQIEQKGAIEEWRKIVADPKLDEMIQLARIKSQTVRLAADGSGAFRTKVKPGRYYVLVTSAHSKGGAAFEITGRLDFKQLTVEAGGQSNVSSKFMD